METPDQPPFIPTYHKPESPGVWMNFDNTVAIYHVVEAGDDFYKAAQDVLDAVREAQDRFPDWPRVFYLDVNGHADAQHGFEDDFVEFQQEFWFSAIAPFLTGFDLPLTGALVRSTQMFDPSGGVSHRATGSAVTSTNRLSRGVWKTKPRFSGKPGGTTISCEARTFGIDCTASAIISLISWVVNQLYPAAAKAALNPARIPLMAARAGVTLL